MKVLIAGPCWGRTSYATLLREYALGLHRRGHEVRIIPASSVDEAQYVDSEIHQIVPMVRAAEDWAGLVEWSDSRLLVATPSIIQEFEEHGADPGDWAIHTVWETTRLPDSWGDDLSKVKAVLTASEFNAEVFGRSDIAVGPIVPEGYDERIFNVAGRKKFRSPPGHTTFVTLADWVPRKNIETLLAAFASEFGGDSRVRLVVKTWSSLGISMEAIADTIRFMRREYRANIQLLPNPLSPAQLRQFYMNGDAFVLPTHGEGWCRPALEAMACGTPAIITGWSAHTSFVTNENGVRLPYTLGPIKAPYGEYQPPQKWAHVEVEALAVAMREVVEWPEIFEAKGKFASKDARRFTKAEAAKCLEVALQEVFQ